MNAQNAILNTVTDITIDIKDNTRTLTLWTILEGLGNGAVAWGGILTVMGCGCSRNGTGNNGAVTKLYE
jgi:hypothetical protein